jgi:hypothetical protein
MGVGTTQFMGQLMKSFALPTGSIQFKPGNVDAYIKGTGVTIPNGTPFTIQFWIYWPNDTSIQFPVFSFGDNGNANGRFYWMGWNTGGLAFFDFGNPYKRTSPSFVGYYNKWTHVTLTATGVTNGVIKVYFDAVLKATTTAVPTLGRDFTDLTLGHLMIGAAAYNAGTIDLGANLAAFRILNRVLEQQEVSDTKDVLLSASYPGLVVQYPLTAGEVVNNGQVTETKGNHGTFIRTNVANNTAYTPSSPF